MVAIDICIAASGTFYLPFRALGGVIHSYVLGGYCLLVDCTSVIVVIRGRKFWITRTDFGLGIRLRSI